MPEIKSAQPEWKVLACSVCTNEGNQHLTLPKHDAPEDGIAVQFCCLQCRGLLVIDDCQTPASGQHVMVHNARIGQ